MSLLNDVLRDLDKQNAVERADREIPAGLRVPRKAGSRIPRIVARVFVLTAVIAAFLLGWLTWQRAEQAGGWPVLLALNPVETSNEITLEASPDTSLTLTERKMPGSGVDMAGAEFGVVASARDGELPASSSHWDDEELNAPEVAAIRNDGAGVKSSHQNVREIIASSVVTSAEQDSRRHRKSLVEGKGLSQLEGESKSAGEAESENISPVKHQKARGAGEGLAELSKAPVENKAATKKKVTAKKTAPAPEKTLTKSVKQNDGHKNGKFARGQSADAQKESAIIVKQTAALSSTSSVTRPEMNISPSSDPVAVGNRQLNIARDLFRRGQTRDAEQLLSELLSRQTHPASQLQLARWLLARGGLQSALELLRDVNKESSPPLRAVKAHAMLAAGQRQQALNLLQGNLPEVASALKFHSLRAGLLQQSQQYDDALLAYAELVEVDPGRGDWWAGLGISLDQTGRKTSALRAYRQALADPGLSQQLAHYAERRIKHLGSQSQQGG